MGSSFSCRKGWRSYIKERMNDSDWQKLYFGLEKESANGEEKKQSRAVQC